MLRQVQDGVHWLEFSILSDIPGLAHAVFLRHGGHSRPPFYSFNLADHSGDNFAHVTANRAKALSLINSPKSSTLVWADQCHGVAPYEVPLLRFDSNAIYNQHKPNGTFDILMTGYTNQVLMIHHADCQASIIYDPIHHVIANVHAGWRGSVQNVYAIAIERLKHVYGSKTQDLMVGIGPSLGPNYAEFVNYKTELPESFWQFQVKPNYFDFWAISEMQLKNSGILPHHMEIARFCTYQNSEDCFSYRREGITGRHGTLVALK